MQQSGSEWRNFVDQNRCAKLSAEDNGMYMNIVSQKPPLSLLFIFKQLRENQPILIVFGT